MAIDPLDRIAELNDRVATLEGIVENLMARSAGLSAPAAQIVNVQVSGGTGTLLDFDGSAYVPAGSLADTISVFPPGGDLAVFRPVSNRWEKIIGGTRIITFTTSSALVASDASQADCPVVTVWYGADPGDTVTIYNELGFAADAGVDGYAVFCPPDSKWKIWQIPCPVGTS